MHWVTELAQDREKWRTLVHTVRTDVRVTRLWNKWRVQSRRKRRRNKNLHRRHCYDDDDDDDYDDDDDDDDEGCENFKFMFLPIFKTNIFDYYWKHCDIFIQKS